MISNSTNTPPLVMSTDGFVFASKKDALFFGLSLLGCAWYALLCTLGILGCRTARKRYRVRPRSPLASAPAPSVPGVSILRPLKGLDANLYENLESTFTQEYPNYEIILSVDEEDDQALPVVRELVSKYPHVKATVVIGDEAAGINPKVNNLVRPYHQAKNDILWVIDSNIMADAGTLARAVDILVGPARPSFAGWSTKRTGVVHHVPFAWAAAGHLGSKVEEAFLNTNHAKMYLAINTVAIDSCVVGKSCLYRRSDLERVNGCLKPIPNIADGGRQSGECGLPAFGRFLAEDNMIASALWHELGLRHDLSCDVARNSVGDMTLSDYIWRRVRWIRVRKYIVLSATLLEPLTECILLSLVAAASLRHLFSVPPWLFFLLHYSLWLFVDFDVYASLAGHPVPSASRMQFLLTWFARELLALPIWILAMFSNEIKWRGRKYIVKRNGEVTDSTAGKGGVRGWIRRLGRQEDVEHYMPMQTSPD